LAEAQAACPNDHLRLALRVVLKALRVWSAGFDQASLDDCTPACRVDLFLVDLFLAG
jgi:hypothetical protein